MNNFYCNQIKTFINIEIIEEKMYLFLEKKSKKIIFYIFSKPNFYRVCIYIRGKISRQ